MKNVCICFIGSNETTKLLGTKETVSDLEFSHYTKEKITLTIVRPISFPEKIKTLIQAVNLSEYVVIEINEVNKYLGEVIILLESLGKKGEFIVPIEKQYLISQVKELIKNTGLKDFNFRVISDTEGIKKLKEELMKIEPVYGTNPLIIIDHYFNVKNVGTVALGFIKGGLIRVKDKFTLLPGSKSIQINSMQSMDVDYKELNLPARVGISLKNCSINDLERGAILTQTLNETTELKGTLKKNKFHQEVIEKAMIINGLIARQATFNEKIIIEKPIVLTGKTIVYDDNKNPRIIGIIDQ